MYEAKTATRFRIFCIKAKIRYPSIVIPSYDRIAFRKRGTGFPFQRGFDYIYCLLSPRGHQCLSSDLLCHMQALHGVSQQHPQACDTSPRILESKLSDISLDKAIVIVEVLITAVGLIFSGIVSETNSLVSGKRTSANDTS